jgi:hypothetical protein
MEGRGAGNGRCGLREAAVRALEAETGCPAQAYFGGHMALIDPRVGGLFVLGGDILLVVEDGRVRAEHAELVCQPKWHAGFPGRKVIVAHPWAELDDLSAASEGEEIEIRLVDDGTCPARPEREPDRAGIARRRAVAANFLLFLSMAGAAWLLRHAGRRVLLALMAATAAALLIARLRRRRNDKPPR